MRALKKCGCPFCSGKKVLHGFNDSLTVCPDIAAEWHPSLNGDLEPSDFTRGSKTDAWWQCPNGHDYPAKINNRVNGAGCPYCAGKKVLSGFNDLSTVNPKIAAEWDVSKNGSLLPSMVTNSCAKNVYWRCPNGHV